jgi:cytochrome c
MSYDNLSSVSQNVLKFYQQLTFWTIDSKTWNTITRIGSLLLNKPTNHVKIGNHLLVCCVCHTNQNMLTTTKTLELRTLD